MSKLNQFFVEADITLLNDALASRQIASTSVVAIHDIPAQTMMTPKRAQFRVIFREE